MANTTAPPLVEDEVTILNGQSLSDAVDLLNRAPVMILTPAAWDSAAITFQISYDGVDYYDLVAIIVGEIALTVATSARQAQLLHSYVPPGVRYLKLRSGTAISPVNQGATRVIKILSRPLA